MSYSRNGLPFARRSFQVLPLRGEDLGRDGVGVLKTIPTPTLPLKGRELSPCSRAPPPRRTSSTACPSPRRRRFAHRRLSPAAARLDATCRAARVVRAWAAP